MAFQFPWTNLHELNLDWFLSKFKQFTDNYLGTTATAESVPNGTPPSVTVTGGELDDDTDIVDPFTFNFKIPAGQPGTQGEQGVPGQDGFSPIATVTKSGTVATITITDVNGTTTTTISDGEVTQAQLDTKAPAILSTVSGTNANFSDGADNMPISELMVDIVPVQSGSGDPAPNNIRPFSGWTGCNVSRAGKNLWNKDSPDALNGYYFISGEWHADNSYRCIGFKCSAGDKFTKSGTGWSGIVTFWNGDTFVSGVNSTTVTVPNGANIAKFACQYSSTNAQLEHGSTATDYEPYTTPTTVSLSWQTEAGTVYGGTIDVATGLLTVTHAMQLMTGATSEAWNLWDGKFVATIGGIARANSTSSNNRIIIADRFKSNGVQYRSGCGDGQIVKVVSTNNYIACYSSAYTDINAFTASLGTDPMTVVYKLATPQTYQLTGQQLKTLLGINNVWADTGDVSVTYPADTKMYIQNLTQPSEDDMIANTSIANGKFFMIGNNLYRATTAIASGSQIIPGTNATAMSLADALNLL